jgi:hypothetical protein
MVQAKGVKGIIYSEARIRVNNQLKILCTANSSLDACEEVIDKGNNGYVHDDDEWLSEYQVWLVRQNILILTISLPKAKKNGEGKT